VNREFACSASSGKGARNSIFNSQRARAGLNNDPAFFVVNLGSLG
jgi:hypothetical protein